MTAFTWLVRNWNYQAAVMEYPAMQTRGPQLDPKPADDLVEEFRHYLRALSRAPQVRTAHGYLRAGLPFILLCVAHCGAALLYPMGREGGTQVRAANG